MTQIDYEREMAFVATARPAQGGDDRVEETLAVVRAACDPDNQEAEFGIIVRSDLKGAAWAGCSWTSSSPTCARVARSAW
jgi:acetyltransferase